MSIDYTTDGLLASVKRRITLPDAQNLFSSTDLIAFMSDELSTSLVPLIHSVQQEYWVYRQDVPIVANVTNYLIPVRGVANGLRLLSLVDNGGNEIEFNLLRPENTLSTNNWLSPYSTSTLYGFNMEDDHIVMFPSSVVTNPTMSLRFRFERRPSQLCATTDAAQITGIAGTVITVAAIPSTWTTATTVDVIKGLPAFPSRADDLAISAVNFGASTITVPAIPAATAVGDWLSVAGTSPIPQIPYELFPYLAQCVANLCMAGMADSEPYKDGKTKEAQMKEDILKLLQPRDMGNVQTVINRGGLFDNGQFWGAGSGNFW